MLKKLLAVVLGLSLLPAVASAQQFIPFLKWTNATGTSATTTNFFSRTASTTNLSTTNFTGASLITCNGTNALGWSGGQFSCVSIPQGTVTSVTGTTNRIASSGGATPAIDISASYVGQSSITTVGTLSAGAVPTSLITGGAALTKTDDTNVTLTLGGSPSTSLLSATSLTLGWTGTLADSRVADNLTISGGTVDNSIIGGTTKAAGSFTNLLASASSTLQNFTGLNSTTTNSTSTSFAISGIASGNCLQTSTGGAIISAGAACGSGSGGAAYPFQGSNNSTSTLTGFTGGLFAYASSTLNNFTFFNATGTNATTTSLAVTAVKSALHLADSNGVITAYAGVTCTNQFLRALSAVGGSTCATVGASDVSLAALTAGTTLTSAGTYTGATTRTFDIDLTHANTWTGGQTFGNSTTTNATTTTQYVSGTVAIATTTPMGNPSGSLSIGAPAGILPLLAIGSTTSNGGPGLVASVAYQPYAAIAAGTSTPDAEFAFQASTTATTLWPNILDVASSTSGIAVSSLFRITQGGSIFAPNTATQSGAATDYWCYDAAGQFIRVSNTCTVSALKFKKDINPLTLGLDTVLQMQPVTYYLKDPLSSDASREQIGFIADWSVKLVPDLITHDSQGEIHGFNYEQYTSVLTKALQEFYGKFQALVARVSGLEGKVNAQQAEIDALTARLNKLEK